MKYRPNIIRMIVILLMTGSPCMAGPEICRYVDARGVAHYCNTRSTPAHTIYIKMEDGTERRFSPIKQSYDTIIRRAGRAYGVDTALIKAVIRAESNFKPGAVSPKGALGLMQIMPQNQAALDILNPFDPAQNIMGGTRHLKQLLARYDKKTTLALAAYNAGTGAVDKYRSIPPYPETRDYVRKVINFYRRYKGR